VGVVVRQARVLSYQIANKKVPDWAKKSHLQFTIELAKSLIAIPDVPVPEAAAFKRRSGTASFTPSPSVKRVKLDTSPSNRVHQPQMLDLRGLEETHPLAYLIKRAKDGRIIQHKCVLCAIRFKKNDGAAARGPRHETLTFCSHPKCLKFLCMDRRCHVLYHEEPNLYDTVL